MRLVSWISILLFSCSEKQSQLDDSDIPVFDSVVFLTLADTNVKAADSPFAEFIPDSFSILDSASGYLDLDDRADMLLVLKSPYEGIASDVPRPLLILLGDGNGQYKLAARNDYVVLNADQGGIFGDPYQEISIGKGTFSILHMGGSGIRWIREISFRYSKENKKWILEGDGGGAFHITTPDSSEAYQVHPEDWNKLTFGEYNNEK